MSPSRIRRGEWVRCYRPRPYASWRLLCFPPAGGSASFFRPWAEELPADVEVWSVQYPGREDRFAEPCVPDMDTLADLITAALEPALDRRTAVFGHSMGSAVGYEVTRRLLTKRPGSIERLFVSARPAPSHQRRSRTRVHLADDNGLVAELGVLGGTDPRVLADAELRDLVLPTIRNDFRLIETYRPAPARPLPIPITALTANDDPRMTVAQAASWVEATTKDFRLAVFDGGHFYLVPHRAAVIAEVDEALAHTPAAATRAVDTVAAFPTSSTPTAQTIDEPTQKESPVEPHPDLTAEGVRTSVAQVLQLTPDAFGADDNLLELGVDSIKLMALASQWQRHGVEVPFGDLAEQPTVSAWSRLLLDALSARPA